MTRKTDYILGGDAYVASRLDPQPSEPLFLHLKDLRASIGAFARSVTAPARILDYGAGSSPYRALFPGSVYDRADIGWNKDAELTYVIEPGKALAAPDGAYDVVLSTQVAEHVPDVDGYFADCLRLLKPGGRFYCSTHGHFEEHGCPDDYWRWTIEGLTRQLQTAGFEIESTEKLTTGYRAMVTFAMGTRRGRVTSLTSFLCEAMRSLFLRSRRFVNKRMDAAYPHAGRITEDLPAHVVYVGIVVVARKPR